MDIETLREDYTELTLRYDACEKRIYKINESV